MNGVIGEPGQSKAGAGEDGFDLVSRREAANTVKDICGFFFSQHSRISSRDAARRVFPLHRIVAAPQKRRKPRIYVYAEPTRIFLIWARLDPTPSSTNC